MKFKFYICYIVLFAISYSQLMDNVDRNAIKSLAIPGWGEKSLNYEERSKLFFIAEASLWISFLGSNHLNNSYIDNYMSFGSHHAEIDLNAIDDYELSLLIVHMSQYDSMEDYNEAMDRQRRNSSYSDDKYHWNWDSDDNRNAFNDLRIKSSLTKKVKNFTISALFLNRFISFFDVVYLNGKKYDINSSVLPTSDNGLLFNCSISF